MAAIVAHQFSDLKKGDRYFFENPAPLNPGAFTTDQLREIRDQTLARLVCNNFDLVTNIQPRVLRVVDDQ
jgi:peroxidase